MQLEDFVAETLCQIAAGVRTAQGTTLELGTCVNPTYKDPGPIAFVQEVEFDVAVTTTEGKESKGGIGVFVGGLSMGTQGQTNASNTSVGRIKFRVPIALPQLPRSDK